MEFADKEYEFAILNAKGFGGNNGTALVASPSKTMEMLQTKYTAASIKKYHSANESIEMQLSDNKNEILSGKIKSRYIFGENVIDGVNDFHVDSDQITNTLTHEKFDLDSTLPYKDFTEGLK